MFIDWSVYFLEAVTGGSVLAFLLVIIKQNSKLFFLKRSGGISIILPLVLLILFNPEIEFTLALKGLSFGMLFILLFGIFDDILNLSWKIQLSFQILLVSLLVLYFGFSVNYFVGPFEKVIRLDDFGLDFFGYEVFFFSFLFILFWFLSVMNSINWIDGINGLSGLVGMLGGVSLLCISLTRDVNQPAIAILAIIFIGAVLGFWWNNFPKGNIEAGTSGSYAMGFFLAVTAIMAGTKIATALIVLVIPLIDAVHVIYERWRNKLPVTKRDKRHLHYKLREIGWSDSKIVLVYFLFISITLFLSFLFETRNFKIGLVVGEVFFLSFFIKKISAKIQK